MKSIPLSGTDARLLYKQHESRFPKYSKCYFQYENASSLLIKLLLKTLARLKVANLITSFEMEKILPFPFSYGRKNLFIVMYRILKSKFHHRIPLTKKIVCSQIACLKCISRERKVFPLSLTLRKNLWPLAIEEAASNLKF